MVTPSVPDYDVGLWEKRGMPTFDYQLDYYADLLEGMEKCQQENEQVLPLLNQLSEFDFFSFFSVDLLSSCGYMPTNEEPCGLDACEIDPAEEVPEAMMARDNDEYEFELDGYGRWDQPPTSPSTTTSACKRRRTLGTMGGACGASSTRRSPSSARWRRTPTGGSATSTAPSPACTPPSTRRSSTTSA